MEEFQVTQSYTKEKIKEASEAIEVKMNDNHKTITGRVKGIEKNHLRVPELIGPGEEC